MIYGPTREADVAGVVQPGSVVSTAGVSLLTKPL